MNENRQTKILRFPNLGFFSEEEKEVLDNVRRTVTAYVTIDKYFVRHSIDIFDTKENINIYFDLILYFEEEEPLLMYCYEIINVGGQINE